MSLEKYRQKKNADLGSASETFAGSIQQGKEQDKYRKIIVLQNFFTSF